MKQKKRNELRDNIKRGFVQRYTVGEIDALFDYVDALEAACKRAADIAVVMSHSAEREIYTILREALDKGK